MAKEAKIIQQAEAEATQAFLEQGALEQATAVGVSGPPQLRRWERNQFLGQFPEQVLWAIPSDVLSLRPVPQELAAAVDDPRCRHIFVKATEIKQARFILQAAKRRDLPVTVVYSPEFRNDVAVVITTTEPHSQDNIFIEPRE